MRFHYLSGLAGVICLLGTCSTNSASYSQKNPGLDFEQPAILEFGLPETLDSVVMGAWFPSVYPVSERQLDTTVTSVGGMVRWRLDIPAEAHVRLTINDQRAVVWLTPADTLRLELTHHMPSDSISFTFSGPLGEANRFLQWKGDFLRSNDRYQKWRSQFSMTADTASTQAMLDSMLALEQRLLTAYRDQYGLPEWFVLYQKDLQTYQIYIRKIRYAGEDLDRLSSDVQLDNERMIGNEYYYLFLDSYILRKYDILDSAQIGSGELPRRFMPVSLQFADQQLKGLNRQAYYLRQYCWIQHYLGRYYDQALADSVLTLITHPPYRRFAESAFTPVLATGEAAPDFELVDQAGKAHRLSDYVGEVVLLAFWFAGCKPCIREIPFENELVEQFDGRPFRLLSICTKTTHKDWLQALKRHDLKATNLYATPEEYGRFQSDYGLAAYPRYVLIDRAGRVLLPNASRPSRGKLRQKIEQLLEGN